MNSLHCPYCDEDLGSSVDDYHESDTYYEHECLKCGKNFTFTISYDPYFSSYKADCLNGEEHDFKEIIGVPKEYFKNRRRCSMCSKEIVVEEKK